MILLRRWFPTLVLLGWWLGLLAPLQADPPARIGRINYLSGRVSFERGDLDEWVPAVINYPMITGDRLWTDERARAELHVGSSAIRLAPYTDFSFLNLHDRLVQIRLSQGALSVRVRALGGDDAFEIDTPNAAVSLLRVGEYRIDVDRSGQTRVTAWHGQAEVTSAGSAFPVRAGQRALVSGSDSLTYDLIDAPRPDDFDNWASGRDRREEQSASVRYVSREMVGYEDLDAYGTWRVLPAYGNVWLPASVPPGWAPYRFGHWVWIEPWGWTWIDEAPWGFAPSHYGRWAFVGGAWYWVPGRPAPRPVYAPALVGFVGGGRWSVSLSFGGGGVAWFPLAPNEVYVPAYRVSPTYVQNINVSHVTNVSNITNVNVTNVQYINRSVSGGVTAVPQATFTGARPVAAAAVSVPAPAIASAPVSGMTAAVAPKRESLSAQAAAGAPPAARPPADAHNRPVVAKTAPPAPPVPFSAREHALRAQPGRPLDESALTRIRQSAPVAQAAPAVRPAAPVTSKGGPAPALRPARAGLPAPQAATVQGFAPADRGAAAAAGAPSPSAPAPRGSDKVRPPDTRPGPTVRSERPLPPEHSAQPGPDRVPRPPARREDSTGPRPRRAEAEERLEAKPPHENRERVVEAPPRREVRTDGGAEKPPQAERNEHPSRRVEPHPAPRPHPEEKAQGHGETKPKHEEKNKNPNDKNKSPN